MSDSYRKIYNVIKSVPYGRVATYGQIARLAGFVNSARLVGYALAASKGAHELPWHRIVNAKGRISIRSNPDVAKLQQLLLESEGILFDSSNSIRLKKYQWDASDFTK